MKKCSKCGVTKELDYFHKNKTEKCGLNSRCISCSKICRIEYKKTFNCWLQMVYSSQVSSSKRRCHDLPSYTKTQLGEWVKEQNNFKQLWERRVESEYTKSLRPSCDRIDDFKGYSIDNIRLITWKENINKGHRDRANGIGTQGSLCVEVIQLTIDGDFIAEHHSAHAAERAIEKENGHAHIIACCKGKLQTAYKYKRMYKEDYLLLIN